MVITSFLYREEQDKVKEKVKKFLTKSVFDGNDTWCLGIVRM